MRLKQILLHFKDGAIMPSFTTEESFDLDAWAASRKESFKMLSVVKVTERLIEVDGAVIPNDAIEELRRIADLLVSGKEISSMYRNIIGHRLLNIVRAAVLPADSAS